MDNFSKVVRIGKGSYGNVFCKIEFKDGKLSITGVEGPKSDGNAVGSCGQIVMSEWEISKYAPGWNEDIVSKFRNIWNEWHLNYMVAGSPKQGEYLKQFPVEYTYPQSHYTVACEVLKKAGLNPDPNYIYKDNPYLYGSAWLRKEVPETVLEFLFNLPDTDIQPAWI